MTSQSTEVDGSALVGRRQELVILGRAVAGGLRGSPGVIAIIGEAGIGKSTLAANVASSARGSGARIVYGAADELDRSAFGLWREPWARLSGPGSLVDAGLVPDEQRWDVLARLSEAVQRAAPVVLVLEDLHWTDSLSSWVLARLAPGLAGDAVAIVATSRPDDSGALLSLVRPAEVLRLGGLDEAEVGVLVSTLAPGTSIDAGALLAETGGNPLFVRELVRSAPAGVSRVVGSALEHSFSSFSDSTRTVLAALALAGADASVALLADALEVTTSDVVSALDEAVASEVLVRQPLGMVAFRHALLAGAATASMDDRERRGLHARLADAWAQATAPGAASQHARHMVAAVPTVDMDTAAPIARTVAAAMVEAGDVIGAVDLLESTRAALELAGAPDPTLAAGVLLDLAAAQEASGDVMTALATFEAAAAVATEAGDAEAAARAEAGAARHVVLWIDAPDRRRRLEEAAARLPPGDHPLRVDLYGRLAVSCLARPDLGPPGTRWGDDAVAMARRIGDPDLLALALIDRHLARITPEDVAAHAAVTDELFAAAERSGRTDLVLVALQWQYAARIARADLAGAYAAVRRLETLAAVMPSPLWRYGALIRRAMLHALAGERDLALEHIDAAWPLGERVLPAPESVGLDVGARSIVAWMFGYSDPQLEARVPLVADQPMRSEVAFFDIHYALSALTVGDTATARAAALKWAPSAAELLYGFQAPTTVAILGLLVADLGLDAHAATVHEVLAPYAGWLTLETSGLGLAIPSDYVLGRLSLLASDAASAVESLRAAVELVRRLPGPTLEARCRWHLADALDAVGNGEAAAGERRGAEVLASRTGVALAAGVESAAESVSTTARLVRRGRTWTVESPLGSAEVAHSTGMAQLARVLGAAPNEVEAIELAGRGDVVERDLGPTLDATAKRAYRLRLAELQAEVDDADDDADIERAARARLELDALMTELQHAVGLGGRDRPVGSSAEKARINVARSLRRAIAAVGSASPALGAHLDVSVRTGRTCRYAPEPAAAVSWTVEF
ncbi:MAG TPA: AAA family ATPase [Acidimicrobiales bacterium]|nr:AAA family ATPase [Acidimicrobiales bacterium]